jgi:DNA-directed RNA polymerase specialized sigma24 family protein
VLSDQVRVESFNDFVTEVEPRLRRALTAAFGLQAGRDATADALVVAWKNWDRVGVMENPVGYLYRVGLNAARPPKKAVLARDLADATVRVPWIEPALIPALAGLPERQRVIVALVHAFEWSLGEVADLLDLSKSTVRTHEQRAMTSLRKQLGVSA